MQDQVIFKARGYDRSEVKYMAYLIFSWFFGFGLLFFFVQLLANEFDTQLALGWLIISIIIFAIEFISDRYLVPSKLFEISRDPDRILWLSVNEKKIDRQRIKNLSYWWNYHFPTMDMDMRKSYLVGRNQKRNSKVRPPADSLNIYVKIELNTGESLVLHQVLGNWVTTPPWDYKLLDGKDIPIIYTTRRLKQFINDADF